MKKLLLLPVALSLVACEGTIFGPKKEPVFVIDSPYAYEQTNDMLMPEVYALAATRSVNKMLDHSAEIYEKNPAPKLYITEFKKLGVNSNIVPSYYDIASGRARVSNIREVAIEDVLGRDPVKLDSEAIDNMLKGKVVMVTGAGGSIGRELCRQIASKAPSLLETTRESLPECSFPIPPVLLPSPPPPAVVRHSEATGKRPICG